MRRYSRLRLKYIRNSLVNRKIRLVLVFWRIDTVPIRLYWIRVGIELVLVSFEIEEVRAHQVELKGLKPGGYVVKYLVECSVNMRGISPMLHYMSAQIRQVRSFDNDGKIRHAPHRRLQSTEFMCYPRSHSPS